MARTAFVLAALLIPGVAVAQTVSTTTAQGPDGRTVTVTTTQSPTGGVNSIRNSPGSEWGGGRGRAAKRHSSSRYTTRHRNISHSWSRR